MSSVIDALSVFWESFCSPLNLVLSGISVYLIYKIFRRPAAPVETVKELPPLPKQDFTLEQLRQYDGIKNPRILMAVHGKVFDVSRGSRFYGPGASYGCLAGRDATRSLGTFSLDPETIRDAYDDLSDLTSEQMNTAKEWEMQFTERYVYVGKLLKPGEPATDYTCEETGEESGSEDHSSKRCPPGAAAAPQSSHSAPLDGEHQSHRTPSAAHSD